MPPTPQQGVVSFDVSFRPDELVAAWRPESRRLVVPTREALRLQQRVAPRIGVIGIRAAATITARVVSASRQGSISRVELVPEDVRVHALERLVSAARGEAIRYATRAPRFLATLPAIVDGPGGPTYMTTFSVSAKGCGLAWTGRVPCVGLPLLVRLGAGNRTASFKSEVCWTAMSGRTAMVGVRFLAGADNAWAMVLGEVERSGAPPA
jgi:hypothetical protein